VLIDLPLATYIPTDYVPDTQLRLRLYRRMATLDTLAEIDEMAAELADRFGPIPDPLHNLLYQIAHQGAGRRWPASTPSSPRRGRFASASPNWAAWTATTLQRYLGESVRVSKSAVWLKKDRGTHEWQIELVQVSGEVAPVRAQGRPSARATQPRG
jgi:transcription-repair coupling factor (superfamily II helicase)